MSAAASSYGASLHHLGVAVLVSLLSGASLLLHLLHLLLHNTCCVLKTASHCPLSVRRVLLAVQGPDLDCDERLSMLGVYFEDGLEQ